jgi:uridylate kinase
MTNNSTRQPRYRRILLKLSGEVLRNQEAGINIDPATLGRVAAAIGNVVNMGVQVGLVVGGGNIFRGLAGQSHGINRSYGDYMGMLATMINALALRDAFDVHGLQARVLSAIEMNRVAEPFTLRGALDHLDNNRVVIFAGGTGNPYFSTDTAAALRACEVRADVLLKATKVDGVYSSDPMQDPSAERYASLTYAEALAGSLKVMDAAAFSLCMENAIPIVVFDFFREGNIEAVVAGEDVGTTVHG